MTALTAFLCLQMAGTLGGQDPDRLPVPAAELKALRETNLFSPIRAKPARRDSSRVEAPPARPKPPVVTGIFFDEKTQTHRVVVEDRNEERFKRFKEPKFLKVGDEVVGLKIQSVSAEKAMILLQGDSSKELRVGDALPDTEQ
jgi:hypothetical protein